MKHPCIRVRKHFTCQHLGVRCCSHSSFQWLHSIIDGSKGSQPPDLWPISATGRDRLTAGGIVCSHLPSILYFPVFCHQQRLTSFQCAESSHVCSDWPGTCMSPLLLLPQCWKCRCAPPLPTNPYSTFFTISKILCNLFSMFIFSSSSNKISVMVEIFM